MKSWRRPLLLVLIGVASTLVLACVIATFTQVVGEIRLRSHTVRFQGPSMEPTIHEGQVLVLQDYSSTGPQRGDIIDFHPPKTFSASLPDQLVKRVVAVPGDTIAITNAAVIVNGKPLSEPYVAPDNAGNGAPSDLYAHIPLPKDQYYVLGDNRKDSIDSRDFGLIDRSSIVGKVVSISG